MGLIDLSLAPGLLAANRRRRWMIARAALNLAFARSQRGAARRLSAALAIVDAGAALRLGGD